MDWGPVVIGVGGAVAGSTVTELFESRRRSRSDLQVELSDLRGEITVAKEQLLLRNAELTALNNRIQDVLDRINADHQP